MFQLPVVNVIEAGDSVPSPASEVLSPIVTLPVGWLWSTIVNWSLPPASVVVRPEVGVTLMAAVSSSTLVTPTSSGSTPL